MRWPRLTAKTVTVSLVLLGPLLIGSLFAARPKRRRADERRTGEGELRAFAGRLITGDELARSGIARELHDHVGQELAAIALIASALARQVTRTNDATLRDGLIGIQQRAQNAADSVRRLSHDLHPGTLRYVGLRGALEAHCRELEQRHEVQVRLHVVEDPGPVGPEVTLCIFRICQEALRNGLTHGAAHRLTVTLSRDEETLQASIADDGSGFDVDAARRRGGGLGLLSMEERAHLLGGTVDIISAPAQGTVVRACLPVAATVAESSPPCAHS